ncbi:MAG: P27 family phage terminase small subunit [Candidatus Aminicenantes bacterium]|nr:P27 family phage terminase small subunit [Candidatus Aminicenantes bacterium]
MKGRKPLSAETHLLEKTKVYGEVKERIENEPKSEALLEPQCPQWFMPSQKDSWNYLADILKNRGIFLDINGPLLELGAIYLAEIRNCQVSIHQKGRGTGQKRNPAIKERDKCAEILLKTLSELNISTTGMARLGSLITRGKKKGNEMEELLD